MLNITKEAYLRIRTQHKDPIKILHAVYNYTCRPEIKIDSLNAFQGLLNLWMQKQGKTLVAGSLTVVKFYDSKFA